MTTCLGKNYSFGLLCMSFVNVYQFYVCAFCPFGFEGGDVGFYCIGSWSLPFYLLVG